MKCLTKCTDRTVRLFPCLKDSNTIVTRINSMKSFKLERLRGFTSFMKKIDKGRDGGNGDEITVSEIELREWSEPNPALGIKEKDELSISTNSFMKKAPPAPRRSEDIEHDRIEKRMELIAMNKNKSMTLVNAMKHEIRQMKKDKQNVKRQHCEQMKEMKQQMKQQQQQEMQQQKQEMQEMQQRHQEQSQQQSQKMDEIMQTVKQLKKEI